MGKPRNRPPGERHPFAEDSLEWMDPPAAEGSAEVLDTVWGLLEKADVDARERKIVWDDGKRLSITESVQRIHADYPDLPLELIEEHLIGWLEMGFAPTTYSQEQLDELDVLTEKWIEDHEQQAKSAQKGGRTRHS